MKATNGPKTLIEAIRYFEDEDVCIRTLMAIRWPDGVIGCPSCGNTNHYYLASRRVWKCKACAKQFSIKVGTIFEDSPIKLSKWLPCCWMLAGAKNGISSYEVHRALGVTQKTAWFMLHRIRAAMQTGSFEKMGGKGGAEVEADETFIGGHARNMHESAKKARGITQGKQYHKQVVLGIMERDGKVRTFHVKDTKANTLVPIIKANVKTDSFLYTDALPSYVMLPDWFRHDMVDHAVEYVNGQVHTNHIENYWSLLKRTLKGTYVSVAPFHLHRYLDEQAFRFNERKHKDADRFREVLNRVVGRRITYNQLIGKVS